MFVCKAFDKEGVTKVNYIATCPILWCRWPKSRKKMDTPAYICKWDDTAYVSTILVLKQGNLDIRKNLSC